MEPDYQNYSLEDLHSVTQRIDRDKYPERYEKVVALISERESSEKMSNDDQVYIEESKGFDSKLGCERLILTGFFAGLFVTLGSIVIGLGIEEVDYQVDMLISAGLYAFLTGFLFFKSRVAASLLFATYSLTNLKIWLIDGSPRGLLTGVLLIVVFFAAMLATFVWHKNYKGSSSQEVS